MRRLHHQQIDLADPIFVRLTAELMLTYRVKNRIAAGLVDAAHLDEVKELEHDSWQALAAYCHGRGFVEAIDGSS
jgi:hypothetical protein